MLGLGKKDSAGDKLSVQVYAVAGDEAFKLAQKLWDENARTVRVEEHIRKEFLHFAYANPECVIWFQRDQGRTGTFELIVRWEADKTYEVFVLTAGQPAGNLERARAVLNSMLTTPSVVLSNPS